jgi:hypothetical protein
MVVRRSARPPAGKIRSGSSYAKIGRPHSRASSLWGNDSRFHLLQTTEQKEVVMQRQAILTVRLVIDDDTTLDEAEEIVTQALEDAELMANIKGRKIEEVDDSGR